MHVRAIAFAWGLLALPAIASAQSYSSGSEQSVLRATGVGWRNHVAVPDGPCGCAMPVRADCYDDCCSRCCLRPLCWLKTIARTLDCLLPCNKCCGGHGGAGCHGCVLGGRCWDGCGACAPGCACPTCSSGLPVLSDPFQDDPAPPKPQPQPRTTGAEVRRIPPPRSSTLIAQPAMPRSAALQPSPWKVTQPAMAPRRLGGEAPASSQRGAQPGVARPIRPAGSESHSGASVLRQTSLELEIESRESAPQAAEAASAAPIIRSQSPAESDIPHNPLRP
jgi:hypothetical protein